MRSAKEIPEAVAHPDWVGLFEAALSIEGSVGNTYRRLYQYSMGNIAFLMYQGVTPQPVATFQRWKEADRHVKRGASAYYIQRPIMVKTGEQDADGNDIKIQRFKPVKSVFPISMTEGEPLPEIELPEWSKQRALAQLAIKEVAFESYDVNTQGYAFNRNLAINPAAAFPEKTLFHEMGHIVLGHTTGDDLDEYQAHRGVAEAEAESTSHLTMNELELMTPEAASVSRAYIQEWLGVDKLNEKSIRAVFKAADSIVQAGRYPQVDDNSATT